MKPLKKLLAGAASLAVVVGGSTVLLPTAANAVGGAAFTTIDPSVDGPANTLTQNSANNANIYFNKDYVWLNGGPTSNGLTPDGQYFFAVLDPGGQPDPNDTNSTTNLSVRAGDPASNRSFTVSGGEVSAYSGTHALDSGTQAVGLNPPDGLVPFINLMPYADTDNNGGVYILAVCYVGVAGTPVGTVDPRDCKYDAFKIRSDDGTTPPASELSIIKDATGAFDRTFGWTIGKSVDHTRIEKIGGTATFNYTVTATHDTGTDSGWNVTGKIYVQNFNPFDVTASSVTDTIYEDAFRATAEPSSTCTITQATNTGTPNVVPAGGETDWTYECDYSAAPALNDEYNVATVSWPDTSAGSTNSQDLAAGTQAFQVPFSFPATPTTLSDASVSVYDNFNSGGNSLLGTANVDGTYTTATGVTASTTGNTTSFAYSRTVPVPAHDCVNYSNIAEVTTNTTSTSTNSNTVTVTVCGPAKTGALTMGFWQNKNGQGIISAANQSKLSTWLKTYHPFSDAPATGVAGYVTTVIKAASCTSTAKTCNAMLKAQMLSTALDVYFSDPALGVNKIGAFNGLGATQPLIGSVNIDLTKICAMIDGSGGAASCSGAFENVSSAFGGATSMTVSAMLTYQNTSDPAVDHGAFWYAQVKATQVLAKDAFDAINNGVAFSA
jgi:hypothetical protein